MNVLHITRYFYPSVGGTQRYIYEISKRLINYKINFFVISLNYDILNRNIKLPNYQEIDNIKIYRIAGIGNNKKVIPLFLPLKLFKFVDIVHIHDVRFLYESVIFLKNFYRYKIVLSTHGFILHTNDLKFLKNFLIPNYYIPTMKKFIDSIICVSKKDYEYFKKFNLLKLHLVENGVDFEKFSKIEKKINFGKFLYFGRIDKNKGLDLLFKLLSYFKNYKWELNLVGDGIEIFVNNLKNLAFILGIDNRIKWWGFLNEEKLFKLISESHICFFPSSYEGFGFTLIEAMSAGCICIANNIKPYADIIEDKENGFLINFDNIEDAIFKFKYILSLSLEKLFFVSNKAKQKAKLYDWNKKIDIIYKIYKNVLR